MNEGMGSEFLIAVPDSTEPFIWRDTQEEVDEIKAKIGNPVFVYWLNQDDSTAESIYSD